MKIKQYYGQRFYCHKQEWVMHYEMYVLSSYGSGIAWLGAL